MDIVGAFVQVAVTYPANNIGSELLGSACGAASAGVSGCVGTGIITILDGGGLGDFAADCSIAGATAAAFAGKSAYDVEELLEDVPWE